MSGVSLPVTRATGRAIVVGHPSCRNAPVGALQRIGFACTESDDPYDAMLQLCRRPQYYSAVIVCLHSLYREELQIISSLKRRFSYIEVWLADTDGRQGALVEAMQLGADGLVDEEGLHRLPVAKVAVAPREEPPASRPDPVVSERAPAQSHPVPSHPTPPHPQIEVKETPLPTPNPAVSIPDSSALPGTDPLLTAEELRALLQESHNPRSN
jgi:hypothetical protein